MNPAYKVVGIKNMDIVTASTDQYFENGNLKMGSDISDGTEYGL